jgi:hypothetical protein
MRKTRLFACVTRTALLALALNLAFCTLCSAQEVNIAQSHPKSLVVAPSSLEVNYTSVEGTTQLAYRVDVDYPAISVLKTISDKLSHEGWKPLKSDFWNPSIPSSHLRGWVQFEDHTTRPTTTVKQWMAQWENSNHDIVSYTLVYRYLSTDEPNLKHLKVFAVLYPATIAAKMPKSKSN